MSRVVLSSRASWQRMLRRRCAIVIALLLGVAGAESLGAAGAESLGVEPPVTAVVFAPDGQAVVAASQAGLAEYDWPALSKRRTLTSELSQIHDVKFLGPQLLLAAGGQPADEGGLERWTWPAGTRLSLERRHDDVIYSVALWQDRLAAAAGDHLVTVRRTAEGAEDSKPLTLAGHSKAVLAAAFLSESLLVTAGRDRSVRLWNLDDQQLIRTLNNHTDEVRALAVRPSPGPLPMVASAGADRTVRLWQPTIGRLVRFARLPSEPLDIAWTADGRRLLASCVDGRLRVIDPDTAQVLAELAAVEGWAYCLAAAPAGDAAVVGGSHGRLARVELPALQ